MVFYFIDTLNIIIFILKSLPNKDLLFCTSVQGPAQKISGPYTTLSGTVPNRYLIFRYKNYQDFYLDTKKGTMELYGSLVMRVKVKIILIFLLIKK